MAQAVITKQDVDALCVLARIGMDDAEKEVIAGDLARILAYVDQIQQVEIPADMQHVYALTNIAREDTDPYVAHEYTETLLAAAPDREDRYVRVQRVLGSSH